MAADFCVVVDEFAGLAIDVFKLGLVHEIMFSIIFEYILDLYLLKFERRHNPWSFEILWVTRFFFDFCYFGYLVHIVFFVPQHFLIEQFFLVITQRLLHGIIIFIREYHLVIFNYFDVLISKFPCLILKDVDRNSSLLCKIGGHWLHLLLPLLLQLFPYVFHLNFLNFTETLVSWCLNLHLNFGWCYFLPMILSFIVLGAFSLFIKQSKL